MLSASTDGYLGRAKVGRVYTVRVLATHDCFRRQGVSSAMWSALEDALQSEDGSSRVDPRYRGLITLMVQGGPCLNNVASRAFYKRLGFEQPCDNKAGKDDLRAFLAYRNGKRVPRATG